VPTDGSDEFAAERLHLKVAYWCCRPSAADQAIKMPAAKLT
jgi:hypothetical protein